MPKAILLQDIISASKIKKVYGLIGDTVEITHKKDDGIWFVKNSKQDIFPVEKELLKEVN